MNSKAKNKKLSKKYHFSKVAIIVFLAITFFVLFVGFAFKTPIESILNGQNVANTSSSQIDYNGLLVYFVDVGQGDCIAIRFPDNKTMLIDAGPTSSTNQMIDYLNNKFFDNKPKVFDYLLLTHSDADHCGGMVAICQNYQVNKIYRPQIFYNYNGEKEETDKASPKYCDTSTYFFTIKAFNDETSNIVFCDVTNCNSSQKILGEDYYFEFFSPTKTTKSVAVNDFSPIMVLNYKGKKLMFTGDATTSGEENLVLDTLPKVDLLKVGHHGSKYSTSANFLDKISPKIAVIQCGQNSYGHPNAETLSRLNYISANIYRNDTNGNIVANVTSNDAQINIYLDKSNNEYKIKVEYIMSGIILISAYFCFGIKPQKNR